MARSFDALVLGGGVIGCSTAFHMARLGAKVALIERGSQVGLGATGRSSACLRLHYSVEPNAVLAKRALRFFHNFRDELQSAEADAGFVQTGHLLVAGNNEKGKKMREIVERLSSALGCETEMLSCEDARAVHPLLKLDDATHVGWEPMSGFADPHLTCQSFAQAAKENGCLSVLNCNVTGLLESNGCIRGVETSTHGNFEAGVTVSCLNIWTRAHLRAWLKTIGVATSLPVRAEKHHLIAARVPNQAYKVHGHASQTPANGILPNVKDLIQESQPYFRAYDGGASLLVGNNHPGMVKQIPDEHADDGMWDESVDLDEQLHCGQLAANRFMGWSEADVVSTWSGCYDVTPDHNPVLGSIPGIEGLRVAFGFSGHGFKLSPVVGALLAADSLGVTTCRALGDDTGLVNADGSQLDIETYSMDRFAEGRELKGIYGGATS